jgi:hypothetical protein
MEEKLSFHYTQTNIHHILRCGGARSPVTSHTLALGETERVSLSDALLVGGFGGSMTPRGPPNSPRPKYFQVYGGWGCGFKSWIWSVLATGAKNKLCLVRPYCRSFT